MYDMAQNIPPMNYNDLFMAQNLGMNPTPMSGTNSPWSGMLAGNTQTVPQPQQPQMPPEINHLNDVIQQYTQNKQNQDNNSGLVQQILSQRLQPSMEDASTSTFRNAIGSPSQYVSPNQIMAERYQQQLVPYSEGLGLANQNAELTGRLIQNNVQQQTALPMAMAELQIKQIAAQIQQQTGLPMAQAELQARQIANQYAPAMNTADINQKNAMAGFYGSALQRDLAEKAFEYANNPAMQQSRMMTQYLGQMSGGNPQPQNPSESNISPSPAGNLPSTPIPANGNAQPANLPSVMQQNGQNTQPKFNPMGAMLAKQFGLENMQIGSNGQPEMIPGVVTPGQKEQDTNFAQSYQTYVNEGGDKRLQNSLDTIDQVIAKLRNGSIKTGGIGSQMFTSPEGQPMGGSQIINPQALIARNLIASSILPQAKALFGARVTNFDAQSLISSQGLDMMADNTTNIQKLERLKKATFQAKKELDASGQYFNQHGTLSGYQPQQIQSGTGSATHIYNPATGQLEPVQ